MLHNSISIVYIYIAEAMSLLHTENLLLAEGMVLLLERMRNRIEDERDFLTRFFECCCFKRNQRREREKKGRRKRVLDEKRNDSRKSHRFYTAAYSFEILVCGGGRVAVVVGVYRRRIGLWLQYTSFSTRRRDYKLLLLYSMLACVEEATLDKVVMMNSSLPSLFAHPPPSIRIGSTASPFLIESG